MRVIFFILLCLFYSYSVFSQIGGGGNIADCIDALRVCDNQGFTGNPDGTGKVQDIQSGTIIPNAGCLENEEVQAYWVYFEIDENAPMNPIERLGFNIIPNGGPAENYDFAVWGPDVSCDNLGEPLRCSFAEPPCTFCPATGCGMGAIDETEGADGDGYVLEVPAVPGAGFFLLINYQSQSTGAGFSLEWTGGGADYVKCNPCRFDSIVIADTLYRCPSDIEYQINLEEIEGYGYPYFFNWVGIDSGTDFLIDPTVQSPIVRFPEGFVDTIRYEVSIASADGQCMIQDTVVIVTNPRPEVEIMGPDSACLDDPEITFSGSPAGGRWSGSATSDGEVIPADLGPGEHIINYRYTDENGCTGRTSTVITINTSEIIEISTPQDSFCRYDDPVTLSAFPEDGFWLPPATGGVIDPSSLSLGFNQLTYVHFNEYGCRAEQSLSVFVEFPAPSQIVPPMQGQWSFCTSQDTVTFRGFLESGGLWEGEIDSMGRIFPSDMDPGTYLIGYTSPPFDCTIPTEQEIVINDPPEAVLVDTVNVCNSGLTVLNFDEFILSGDSIGVWSYVSDSIGSGSFPTIDFADVDADTILFQYTTASALDGCDELELDLVVIVEDCPCPSLALEVPDTVCSDAFSVNLNALKITEEPGSWEIIDTASGPSPATLMDSIFSGFQSNSGAYLLQFNLEDTVEFCPDSAVLSIYVAEFNEVQLMDTLLACNVGTSGEYDVILDLYAGVLSDDVLGSWIDIDASGASGDFSALNFEGVDPGLYRFEYTAGIVNPPCEADRDTLVVNLIDCSCPALMLSPLDTFCNTEIDVDLSQYLTTELDGTWSLISTPGLGNPPSIAGDQMSGTSVDTGRYSLQYSLTEQVPDGCPSSVQGEFYIALQPALDLQDTVRVCNTDQTGAFPSTLDLNEAIIDFVPDGVWSDIDDSGAETDGDVLNFEGVVPGFYIFRYTTTGAAGSCSNVSEDMIVEVVDCNCPSVDLVSDTAFCNSLSAFDLNELNLSDTEGSWSMSAVPPGSNPAQIDTDQLIIRDADAGIYELIFELQQEVPDGCPQQFTVDITISDFPSVDLPESFTICNSTETGETTMINLTDLIMSGSLEGTWSDLDGIDAGSLPLLDFEGVEEGTYRYRYTVVGEGECPDGVYEININVVDCECPEIPVVSPPDFCISDGEFDLDVLVDPGEMGEWMIEESSGADISEGILDYSQAVPGVYWLRFDWFSDLPSACPDSVIFEIQIYPQPIAGLFTGDTSFCIGSLESIDLFGLLDGEDEDGEWSFDGSRPDVIEALDPISGVVDLSQLDPGDYRFFYSLDANAECEGDETQVEFTINSVPLADAGPDREIMDCEDRFVTIGVPGDADYSYRWTKNGNLIAEEDVIEVNEAGTYLLTVVSESGCISQDEVSVTARDFIISEALVTAEDPLCPGDMNGIIRVDQIVGGVEPYSITLNGEIISGTVVQNLSSGSYELSVSDANNCTLTKTIELEEPVGIAAMLPADTMLIQGDEINLSYQLINGVVESARWSGSDTIYCLDCEEITISPLRSETVDLLVVNPNGCESRDQMFIQVRIVRRVYFPNIFSPNGDDLNDTWFLYGAPELNRVRDLRIYDRWGALVHQVRNMDPSSTQMQWNGRFKNQDCPAGVYIYVAELEFQDGEIRTYSGDLTLMR